MKKRKMVKSANVILAILLLLLSLCSCAEKESHDEDIIIGTWKSTKQKVGANWLPMDDASFCWTFTFAPDGVAKITLGEMDYPHELTWVFDGSDEETLSYSILDNGSVLTGVIYSKELGFFVYSDMAFEKTK